jgi:hypothetical protein
VFLIHLLLHSIIVLKKSSAFHHAAAYHEEYSMIESSASSERSGISCKTHAIKFHASLFSILKFFCNLILASITLFKSFQNTLDKVRAFFVASSSSFPVNSAPFLSADIHCITCAWSVNHAF